MLQNVTFLRDFSTKLQRAIEAGYFSFPIEEFEFSHQNQHFSRKNSNEAFLLIIQTKKFWIFCTKNQQVLDRNLTKITRDKKKKKRETLFTLAKQCRSPFWQKKKFIILISNEFEIFGDFQTGRREKKNFLNLENYQ